MHIQVISLYIASVVVLLLGIIVLARSYRKLYGWFFITAVLGVVFWAVGDALILTLKSKAQLDTAALIFYIGPMAIPVFMWLFALSFPERRLARPTMWLGISLFALATVTIILFPRGLLKSVEITQNGLNLPHINPTGFFFYAAYFSTMFTVTYVTLIRLYVSQKVAISRTQILYVLVGLLLASLPALFTNLALPLFETSSFIWLGPIFSISFVSAVTVSIIKHRLFDIRLVVARTLGYAFSLAVLSATYGFIVFGIANVIFHLQFSVATQIFLSVATGIAALSFQRIKRFFDKTTNQIFYRDAYDAQELFGQLNHMLVSSLDIKYLMVQSISIIETFLKPDFAVIGLRNGDGQRMFMSRKLSFTGEDITRVRHLTPRYHHKVIIADYLEGKKYAELRELMLANNVAVIVRLAQNLRDPEGGLGYLVLGNKKSGNPYTQQDVRVLDTVANELIIAVQNALHFEEIQNFNATLQQQVDEATRKLRRTNEKLKALDETKDDFISMASHQLRTPLTSVKGYLSMVLEGDAGKVNATQAKMLGQAFISSQRMVYLIADLLNVSRLRTGKFVIEQHPTNLATMIEEELAQLTETAAARELKLTYDKPKDFPDLMLDETKTRQVIMNFVDNAIYYTPAGGQITVRLTAQADTIELRVTDNGIGVPKSEQHHLFTKFYRAHNAQKARPDGTGLGLFMAKKVVVGQGGSIVFESAEGQGSTFGFRFSRRKLTADLPKADSGSGKAAAPVERQLKQPA